MNKIGQYLIYTPYIAKGNYSKVYYGRDGRGKEVAIKIINRTKITPIVLKYVYQEIEILNKINNKNIIYLKEVIEDGKYIYIITEYCNYKTLTELFKLILYEQDIHCIFKQIVLALVYIHKNNIYHKDLKPNNIFMNVPRELDGKFDIKDIQIKIGDFGFSKQLEKLENLDSLNETLCGTPLYLAPEILINHSYTDKSDLWSLGIILFELIFHYYPFGEPKTQLELIKRITNFAESNKDIIEFSKTFSPYRNTVSPFHIQISNILKSLLFGLLEIDYNNRISWLELENNTWINSIFIEEKDIKDKKEDIDKINNSMLSMSSIGEENTTIDIIKNRIKENYLSIDRKEGNETKTYGKYSINENFYLSPQISSMSKPISIPSSSEFIHRDEKKKQIENKPSSAPSPSSSLLSILKQTLRFLS
jgi:serine/threonine kinase 33